MASTLTVPVVQVANVRAHPNADKLDLCDVLGYQMAVPKDMYKDGDVGIYFPADTLIPDEWAEKFGVKNFLRGKNKDRVGKIRLRGEPSFGLIVGVPDGQTWELGENVAEYFGAQKYEPPIRAQAGDAAPYDESIDPFFDKYTDIENGRIFVDVFEEGEEVVVTEKIHGTNSRFGYVSNVLVAGSMTVRRKKPERLEGMSDEEYEKVLRSNTYWSPLLIPEVADLVSEVGREDALASVIMYGEVYGGSVQSLNYGIEKGKGFGFRAFDLSVNGKYVDWIDFKALCAKHGVETVPVLFEGPYSFDLVKELADGKTTMGADHIREGVVVKPLRERTDPKVGRAILKYIGTEYELSKHKERDTTDV